MKDQILILFEQDRAYAKNSGVHNKNLDLYETIIEYHYSWNGYYLNKK